MKSILFLTFLYLGDMSTCIAVEAEVTEPVIIVVDENKEILLPETEAVNNLTPKQCELLTQLDLTKTEQQS